MKTLRPHQQKALEELGNGKVLKGGVGSGKTLVAVAYYVQREAPRDVYVITTAKKRDSLDWEEEFASFGIGKAENATTQGVLTVDSWNNIARYRDVRDAFFVFDEQRAVGSGAWAKSFIAIARVNRWIMLSATPGDTWLDLIPVFIANGLYKNRTEFIRQHVIYSYYQKFPKVDRYVGEPTLVRHKARLFVDMPFERHTNRIINEVLVSHDPEKLEKVTEKRWNVFEEKPLRDIAEMFSVSRKVVNTDPSRLSSVERLMETHPRLIVFYNFNYELEQLRTLGLKPTTNQAASSSTDSTSHRSASTESATCGGANSKGTGEWASSATEPTRTATSTSASRPTTESTSSAMEQPSSGDRPTPSSERYSGLRSLTPVSRSTSDSTKLDSPSSTTPHLSAIPTTHSSVGSGVGSSRSSEKSSPQSSDSTGDSSRRSTTSTTTKSDGSKSPPSMPSSGLVVAEWNGHKHEPIPKTDRWLYLVQYVAGSEGWNCTETDATAFYSLTYSYKNWEQAFGRIDRMNTPFTDLHYYILQSNSWIDKAIRKALNAKRNFNESAFMRKKAS